MVSGRLLADVPADQVKEVAHLLQFVENSGCVIERNGTEHEAKEAVEHIQKKYDYFRDDIKNTEDFISYSASKSTMSGNFYTVKCRGVENMRTQDWLLQELQSYRSGLKK